MISDESIWVQEFHVMLERNLAAIIRPYSTLIASWFRVSASTARTFHSRCPREEKSGNIISPWKKRRDDGAREQKGNGKSQNLK